MPLLSNTMVVYAKAETSYGVDPSPTVAGTDAVLTSNLSITPLAGPTASRNLNRSVLGAEEQIRVGNFVQVSFDVEVAGSGTAGTAPAYGALFEACKLTGAVDASPATSYDYTPTSGTSDGSVRIVYQMGGQQHVISGARGTVSLSMNPGEIPRYSFSFTGIYNTPTTTAALTPDWSDYTVPVPVTNANTTTASLHSQSLVMTGFSLDFNNNVVYRNVVGSESVIITDRNVTGTISFEAPAISTKNWFNTAKDTTTGALSLVHGTASGNIVTLSASKVQLTDPTYSDSDGITTIQASLVFIPSDAGNDELTISCS